MHSVVATAPVSFEYWPAGHVVGTPATQKLSMGHSSLPIEDKEPAAQI